MFKRAEEKPNAIALIYEVEKEIEKMTYNHLRELVLRLATRLKNEGVSKGDLVAVRQPRGVYQIISIYAILAVGAAYVPINVRHPRGRVENICGKGNIKLLLTQEDDVKLDSVKRISIANLTEAPLEDIVYDSNSLAYVIFTSGSTGEPKGVMISHSSAMNTIEDINNRFDIGDNDTGFNLSEIDFDLSVYDFFGILGAGGKLVLLNEDNRRDARHWIELVKGQGVTVWNSVPAIYDMLMTMAESDMDMIPIKKIFLSGDWISVELVEKTRRSCENARFVSLGGATEASIWSNFYEVSEAEEKLEYIPYGMALKNQELMVVDEEGNRQTPLKSGELHIGGAGVAEGYLQDSVLTQKAFYEKDGKRWYKTGDLAMEGEDGNYIILGRIDYQVKVNGYRIELGEIENTMEKLPGVDKVVAMVSDEKKVMAAYTKKKTQSKVCTLSSVRDEAFKGDEIESRKKYVAQIMGYIMGLSQDAATPISSFNNCNAAYMVWIDFLVDEGFAVIEEAGVRSTGKLSLEQPEDTEKYELLKKVFYKQEDPLTLLSSESFAPEQLVLKSKETEYYVTKFIEPYLNQGKRIAILDARSGMIAQRLLETGRECELTLFDEAQGMLEDAKNRVSHNDLVKDYVRYSEGVLEDKYEDAFDVVLSVNTLHTWQDINHALLLAEDLLKSGGTFLALEYFNMDAMGLLTSALIEEGFLVENEMKTPFRSVEEWREALSSSTFEKSEIIKIENTEAMLLRAEKGEENININFEDALKENLASYMVPQTYKKFMWYPLTENGKIDRKRIKELLQMQAPEQREIELEGTQRELWVIWKEYLGKHLDTPEKNFFELGGDSLLATKLLVRIQKHFGVNVTLAEMLENSTVEKMAELVDRKTESLGGIEEGEI